MREPAPARPAVLVTGGAKRIGAAIVRRFAHGGWRCLIHCGESAADAQTLKMEIIEAGGEASVIRFDLSDPDALCAGMDAAFREAPELSVLINSASIFDYDEAASPSPEVWRKSLGVNALAPVLLAARFHANKAADRPGCIVNLLDQKLANLNPDYFSYTVSKAALQAASQIMASAFAPETRVVNIAPGLVLPSGDQTDSEFEKSSTMNVLQRRTRVEEVVEGVFHVVTSAYATGQTLFIDSGQSLMSHERDVMFLVRQEEDR